MDKPHNPRAFPSGAVDTQYGGMTLRDWFAGKAIRMMLNVELAEGRGFEGDHPSVTDEKRAARAYQLADAMLAEREKGGAA